MTARCQCECGVWMPWETFIKHIETMHEEKEDCHGRNDSRGCAVLVGDQTMDGLAEKTGDGEWLIEKEKQTKGNK